MSDFPSSLEDELRQEDEEYRYAYAEDFLNTSVATQIRVIREQRGLTQDELAQKIGTKQAGVSRLENVNYSAWKTETLRKIARALKVRLKITFETFGTLVNEAETFSRQNLERPSFEQDPVFHQIGTRSEARNLLIAQNLAPAPYTYTGTGDMKTLDSAAAPFTPTNNVIDIPLKSETSPTARSNMFTTPSTLKKFQKTG